MRIAYGIFGYGRGHATRAASVLPDLVAQHQVLIFAGGDAFEQLSGAYPICRIPTLGYQYTRQGRRSNYLIIRHNLWHVLDILGGGPTAQAVTREIQDFRPDVVISDAEPWTHRAAARLGIPRIGFDHFGILAHCAPPIPVGDRLRCGRDVFVYRVMMRQPERVIVSSFYDAPPRRPGVACVGPLLREEVLRIEPTRGAHLLVYFNKGEHLLTPDVELALRSAGVPALIYGTSRRGVDANLDFRPLSNLPFLEDLASCRAVFSTAGNQLVGEAMHLGKPILVTPEDCVEQRLNAAAVARLGVGAQIRHRDISADRIRQFLDQEQVYQERIRTVARDGRGEALATIDRFLAELAPNAAIARQASTYPAPRPMATRS